MIKLLPWDQFITDLDFNEETGLCDNLCKVYCFYTSTRFNTFLRLLNLNTSFPIGVNSYRKDTFYRGRRNPYYSDNIKFYQGMQEALRHNLYNRFVRWLVEKFPNLYYL